MGKKILIVDDEPDVVSYLTAILQSNGYIPYSANNADQGLELAYEVMPDLVCLDIMMPEKLGISMFKKIKLDDKLKNIPILVISGVVQNSELDFRKMIPDPKIPLPEEILEKPIDIDQFLETISRLIDNDNNENRPRIRSDEKTK